MKVGHLLEHDSAAMLRDFRIQKDIAVEDKGDQKAADSRDLRSVQTGSSCL